MYIRCCNVDALISSSFFQLLIDMVEEDLDTPKFLVCVRVESDVECVGSGYQLYMWRWKLVATHFGTVYVGKSFNLGVILCATCGPFHLVSLEGHEDPRTRRTSYSELAVVVRRIEGRVVWRVVNGKGFVVRKPNVPAIFIGFLSGGGPEVSAETEFTA